MLVYHNGTPIWRLHTGLHKFVQNISTNIWSYKKRTDFKLGEVTSFLISHNNTISWLYLPNGFRIIFLFCFIAWQCKPRIDEKYLILKDLKRLECSSNQEMVILNFGFPFTQTSNLSSSVMVLKFFSLRRSHSLTTESSADVAK